MKHVVIGNIFVMLAILFLGGDVLLLLFTFFVEIFVGIACVFILIYLGHEEVNGVDYRGMVGDLGLFSPIVFYVLFESHEHLSSLVAVNFEDPLFSSWKFWGVLFSVILGQIYIFTQTFILNEDYRLPSPSFYILDILAKSFALIVATSAFWAFFNSFVGILLSVILFFPVKILAELFIQYVILDAGLAKADHQYLFRGKLREKLLCYR